VCLSGTLALVHTCMSVCSVLPLGEARPRMHAPVCRESISPPLFLSLSPCLDVRHPGSPGIGRIPGTKPNRGAGFGVCCITRLAAATAGGKGKSESGQARTPDVKGDGGCSGEGRIQWHSCNM